MVGLEWISGTVSCIKFAKALGLTIGHSPEDLNENYLKLLSCQSNGVSIIEEHPEKIFL